MDYTGQSEDARERAAHLVPQPRSVVLGEGVAELPAELSVRLDVADEDRAAVLRAIERLPVRVVAEPGGFVVRVRSGATPVEGYVLDVAPDGVTITAADVSGVRHAVTTLRQLLPDAGYRQAAPGHLRWLAPVVRVEDAPRFAWRGMMLDVARHFMPKREVLRHVELMSMHKLNTLHLHLSDDQGWRVRSPRFPRLHEVGSWRSASQISHYADDVVLEHTPHGGCYSHDDIAEIVAYAADRGIEVVPEIGVPGHTGALLAAYPEFGSPATPRSVRETFGVHDAVLAPSEESIEFLRQLFDELLPLFTSRYVHAGGDESVLRAWDSDPVVRDFANSRGLSGSGEVLAALMAEVRRLLAGHGRTMVTWDDSFATSGSAAADQEATATVIMAWRGPAVARRAAAAGHDVVLTPVRPTYLDYYQDAHPDEPRAIGGPVTLDDVASWEPIPPDWSAAERARVRGIQCQMWTESVDDPRLVDYLLYPRACAFAEVAWAEPTGDVQRRLPRHLDRLAAAGVEFRPLTGPAPWQRAGTGRRAHRPGVPMDERLARYASAAATGTLADDPKSDGHPGGPDPIR